MEKLILNAVSQFDKFGKIVITIYPNREACDSYIITENSIDGAIELISHVYQSINDDIKVSHANAI